MKEERLFQKFMDALDEIDDLKEKIDEMENHMDKLQASLDYERATAKDYTHKFYETTVECDKLRLENKKLKDFIIERIDKDEVS